MMPSMEFDAKYGAIVEASQPWNNLLIPFYWPIVFFEGSPDGVKWFNDIMCRICYFPVAITMTIGLFIFNLIVVPLVYLYHSFRLFKRVFRTTSIRKSMRKACQLLWFMSMGLVQLILSIFVDPFKFMMLLYAKTDDQYLDLLKILQDDMISMKALNLFEQTCDIILA